MFKTKQEVLDNTGTILERVFRDNGWSWHNIDSPKRDDFIELFNYLIERLDKPDAHSSRAMSGRLAVVKNSFDDKVELYLHLGNIYPDNNEEDN